MLGVGGTAFETEGGPRPRWAAAVEAERLEAGVEDGTEAEMEAEMEDGMEAKEKVEHEVEAKVY